MDLDGQLTQEQFYSTAVGCISNDFDVNEFEREEEEDRIGDVVSSDSDDSDDDQGGTDAMPTSPNAMAVPACSTAASHGRRWAWRASQQPDAALLRLLGHGRRKAAAGAIFGSAAPWIRARQSPAPSAVSAPGRRHVSPLPRQGNRHGQKC